MLSAPPVSENRWPEALPPEMRSRATFGWLAAVAGAGMALAAMLLIYRGLDPAAVAATLERTDRFWLAVLAASILFEQFVHGWKWRQLLYDLRRISSWRLTGAILAGHGANLLVPVGISPLVRAWLVARLEGLAVSTVLVTTAIMRFVDGIAFALLAALAAVTMPAPGVGTGLAAGLAAVAAANLVLFAGVLFSVFRCRGAVGDPNSRLGGMLDRLAARVRGRFGDLRILVAEGIVWPSTARRRAGVVLGALAAKLVAATHFAWAGLAVGVSLGASEYLLLMIVGGAAFMIARFVRMPGGFAIGSALVLQLLGVPDDQAAAMILLNQGSGMVLVSGIGLLLLWRHGFDIVKPGRAAG